MPGWRVRLTGLWVSTLLSVGGGNVGCAAEQLDVVELGSGEMITFYSKILDEKRTIYVSSPRSYESSIHRYPVLYVLDGEWHFPLAASIAKYLSECDASDVLIPEMIVVGIVNVDRNRDFTPTQCVSYKDMDFPTSGEAERYLSFLSDELIPLVESRYRTLSHRALAGWSFGGLFTVYTFIKNSALFNAYLGISPSLWWDDDVILREYRAARDLHPTKLVVTVGTVEEGGWTHTAVMKFAQQLSDNATGELDFTLIEIERVGHNLSVPQGFFKGLRALYADWAVPDTVVNGGLEAVREYYGSLSYRYGDSIRIPQGALVSLGWDLWNKKRRPEAIGVLRLCVEEYPEIPLSHYYLGRMYSQSAEPVRARACFQKAIAIENRREVPSGVSLQMFQAALRDVPNDPSK